MPEGEEDASNAAINRRNLGIVNEILEMVPVNNGESTKRCVIYTDGEIAVLPEPVAMELIIINCVLIFVPCICKSCKLALPITPVRDFRNIF
jgi:hypothetical protein